MIGRRRVGVFVFSYMFDRSSALGYREAEAIERLRWGISTRDWEH